MVIKIIATYVKFLLNTFIILYLFLYLSEIFNISKEKVWFEFLAFTTTIYSLIYSIIPSILWFILLIKNSSSELFLYSSYSVSLLICLISNIFYDISYNLNYILPYLLFLVFILIKIIILRKRINKKESN